MGSGTCIVLVSGGLDSAVCIAIAAEKYLKLGFLFVNYGQKTLTKELECFYNLAKHYHVPKSLTKVADITFLKSLGGSSLTDNKIKVSGFNPENKEIPSSYVPFRNTHIIATAVSWSELIGAEKIYIGANYEDSPGYPDCRPEYFKAYNQLIRTGSKGGIATVETPLLFFTKKDIVKKGTDLGVPFEHTWSCYQSAKKACGKCDSCGLRLRGFKEANLVDPIAYS